MNIARNMQLGLLVYRLDDRADDRTLRLVIANPSAERLLGVPKHELLGRRIDEVFPALRVKGIPALFADVIRTGATRELRDFDYTDGRVLRNIWAFKAFPLPDDSVGVLFESVAAQRQTEELVNNIAQGVAGARFYDKQGRIIFSNDEREIGTQVDLRAEASTGCHPAGQPLRAE